MTTQQPGAEQCPPSVCHSSDLLLGFVNTAPWGGNPETMNGAEDLSAWLARAGLLDAEADVTGADAAAARELRDAFIMIFRAHSGCADGQDALPAAERYIQRIAQRYPLVSQLSAEGCRLVPAQDGVLGGFGALFAAAADLAARGGWARLKMCKDPSCHRGFFDKTRNSSGLYCSTACSTRMAARAYRSRSKKSA
ncbi:MULTISPECIES: CGNR zinc finger domain-containing protein [unclassified Streptomyces]|uniref:CGNR zinc finger domain-containing protein n=1 Tax=unclassified Streptomyces TaxID=2593676 RepID=UPI000D386D66|nr:MULTISPECIES: CGNR zinc finger domain-containing protein [unclassified Streptomyces]PTM87135.1 putative RNA-binding Zn ribbon-like protein [Streptomyces sp. VMFN-G11Ma]